MGTVGDAIDVMNATITENLFIDGNTICTVPFDASCFEGGCQDFTVCNLQATTLLLDDSGPGGTGGLTVGSLATDTTGTVYLGRYLGIAGDWRIDQFNVHASTTSVRTQGNSVTRATGDLIFVGETAASDFSVDVQNRITMQASNRISLLSLSSDVELTTTSPSADIVIDTQDTLRTVANTWTATFSGWELAIVPTTNRWMLGSASGDNLDFTTQLPAAGASINVYKDIIIRDQVSIVRADDPATMGVVEKTVDIGPWIRVGDGKILSATNTLQLGEEGSSDVLDVRGGRIVNGDPFTPIFLDNVDGGLAMDGGIYNPNGCLNITDECIEFMGTVVQSDFVIDAAYELQTDTINPAPTTTVVAVNGVDFGAASVDANGKNIINVATLNVDLLNNGGTQIDVMEDIDMNNNDLLNVNMINGMVPSSDRRLKHSIEPLDSVEAFERVMRTPLVQYRWHEALQSQLERNGNDATIHRGVIAQDVKKDYPHAVTRRTTPYQLDAETTIEDLLQIDKGAFVFDLMAAFQHLAQRVQELETACGSPAISL